MKNILIHAGMILALLLTACGNNPKAGVPDKTAASSVTIGEKVYRARFYDNAAAEALMEQMPMELDMEDLHGNEKYHYLPDSLPTDTESIGSIRAGDIMLFGSDCLVLFYEDFQTTFSYTRIGHLEDPADLADTLGSGSVKVSFDKAE